MITNNLNSFDEYSTKRVSYILVTKNRAALLKKCLERTKYLLTKKDELIVVDGESNDKTIEVIRKHKKIIDKFISEPDLMPSHGANKGLLVANGKYIKMLTDDDVVYKNAMEKAIEVLDRNPDIDILLCGGTRYKKSTKRIEVVNLEKGINYGKEIDDIFKYGINAMGFVVRRSSLSKTGLFPLDPIPDFTLTINALRAGAKVKFCRLLLYHQYVHDLTFTKVNNELVKQFIFRAVRKNASKIFFLRFAFNWFLNEHPFLKIVFSPLIIFIVFYKKIKSIFLKRDNLINNRRVDFWDGEFA